jgi:hypothetical protein
MTFLGYSINIDESLTSSPRFWGENSRPLLVKPNTKLLIRRDYATVDNPIFQAYRD